MAKWLCPLSKSGKVVYSDRALIEIVYVNVLFIAVASVIVVPLLALIFWSDTPMSGSGNCYAPPDGCQ